MPNFTTIAFIVTEIICEIECDIGRSDGRSKRGISYGNRVAISMFFPISKLRGNVNNV